MTDNTKRDEEIRRQYLAQYSHASVRDRYDADLMMAGFADGAAWADAHPPEREPVVVDDAMIDRARDEIIARINNVIQPTRGTIRAALTAALTPDGQEKNK